MPKWASTPCSNSEKFENKEITLKEILSRTPYTHKLYKKTYDEDPKVWPVELNYIEENDGYFRIVLMIQKFLKI